MDQFGFVEAVDRLSEGVVIGIPDAVGGWFNSCFSQAFGLANGQILPAAITIMYQPTFLNRSSIMKGLFQSIENKICLGRPRAPHPMMRSANVSMTKVT